MLGQGRVDPIGDLAQPGLAVPRLHPPDRHGHPLGTTPRARTRDHGADPQGHRPAAQETPAPRLAAHEWCTIVRRHRLRRGPRSAGRRSRSRRVSRGRTGGGRRGGGLEGGAELGRESDLEDRAFPALAAEQDASVPADGQTFALLLRGEIETTDLDEPGEGQQRRGAVAAQQHVPTVGQYGAVGEEAGDLPHPSQPVGPVGVEPARGGVHDPAEDRLRDHVEPTCAWVGQEGLGVTRPSGIGQVDPGGLGLPRRDPVERDDVADAEVVPDVGDPDVAVPGWREGLDVHHRVGREGRGALCASGPGVDGVEDRRRAGVVDCVDHPPAVDQAAGLGDRRVGEGEQPGRRHRREQHARRASPPGHAGGARGGVGRSRSR